MPQTSTASARWNGSLFDGTGTVSTTSPAIDEQPLAWKARVGEQAGTTPEELIAAAWSSCFAMAFSHQLAEAGHPADQLDVKTDVSFGPKDGGGFEIKGAHITVSGSVPGIDAAQFGELAEGAKHGCPVSVAFAGNLDVTLDANLAG